MNKIVNFFKIFGEWILYSSVNAKEISITVKSIGFAAIPAIALIFAYLDIPVTNEDLELLFNEAGSVIIFFGSMIASLGAIWGIVRKIASSLAGKNEVLKKHNIYK